MAKLRVSFMPPTMFTETRARYMHPSTLKLNTCAHPECHKSKLERNFTENV